MNNGLAIRVSSFALAVAITLSLLAGLDTLAQDQHAGGLTSQSCARDPVFALQDSTVQAALRS